ncbi:MAG: hypothetical protein EOM20_14645 [Spartobacteria bacterium]|nr:hypothetical protein [Spartobacteria bacterium]
MKTMNIEEYNAALKAQGLMNKRENVGGAQVSCISLLADLRDLKRELEIAVKSQLAGPNGRHAFQSCLGSLNTLLDKHDKANNEMRGGE